MRTIRDVPCNVEHHEHLTIPMRDGTLLAARLWLPEDAEQNPVPAILEYIPYRKRDLTRNRDDINHPYLAGHGYACIRVDLRGSGDSEGVLRDQYLKQEQDDGVDVIAWLREQPWCNGRVGMMGISWGGFNALQIAARRPPGLDAIVSVCATDDLYRDNMHYMGGCLLSDNLSEATTMFAYNACPPDPMLVGEKWREMWLQRLKESGLWLDIWLNHQRRDDFWKPGSVAEDYSAIACPVLLASGWADGFTDAIFRLLEHLEVPCRGLIGPWAHKYPHMGVPGPAIGFLQEVVRWFDHWLKDIDREVEEDPDLWMWMQDSAPPQTQYQRRPGRWVCEKDWPSPHIERCQWLLQPGQLYPKGAAQSDVSFADHVMSIEQRISSPLTTGLFAGKWCSYASTPDLPADQRLEDGGALIYETEPLHEAIELCGIPKCKLRVAADQPVAMVAVRLEDVRPSGEVSRISYGLFNLTHRNGHEQPKPLEPGVPVHVTVPLNGIAQRFPAGHRIRLAISSSYWPLAWAPPKPVELTLSLHECHLELPVRIPHPDTERQDAFSEPEGCAPTPIQTLQQDRANWEVHYDLANNVATLEVTRVDGSWYIKDADITVSKQTQEFYTAEGNDPSTLRGETITLREFSREGWHVTTKTRTLLTCDTEAFHIHAQLDAWEGERRVYETHWDRRIPRDLV